MAAPHSIQPCFTASSQSGINHFAICVNRHANLSFTAANSDIWISRTLFTFCTGLTDLVQAGLNKTAWRDMSNAKNGFSVMLNKPKGVGGVNKCIDSANFDLETHTGSSVIFYKQTYRER